MREACGRGADAAHETAIAHEVAAAQRDASAHRSMDGGRTQRARARPRRRLAQLLLGVERGEVLRPETLANMKRCAPAATSRAWGQSFKGTVMKQVGLLSAVA